MPACDSLLVYLNTNKLSSRFNVPLYVRTYLHALTEAVIRRPEAGQQPAHHWTGSTRVSRRSARVEQTEEPRSGHGWPEAVPCTEARQQVLQLIRRRATRWYLSCLRSCSRRPLFIVCVDFQSFRRQRALVIKWMRKV